VVYHPEPGYYGLDSFTFEATDGIQVSNVATVNIAVQPTERAPVASDASIATNEDTPVAITLAATDVNGDALSYGIVTPPQHGSLSGLAPNVVYTPALHYFGPDRFTFKANDGHLDSAVATVSIAVTFVDYPPVAAFSVPGPERNVASADSNLAAYSRGGVIVAVSSQQGSSAQSAIDDSSTTVWSTTGPRDQFLTVQLQGLEAPTIDRVRIVNGYPGAALQHFDVLVSPTTADAAAFTTVLSAVAQNTPSLVQEFLLPSPVRARYVQLLEHDNYGDASQIVIASFEAIDGTRGGIASYPASAPSYQIGNRPEAMMDGDPLTSWLSGPGPDQSIVMRLVQDSLIDRVRLLSYGGSSDPKDFDVLVSTTTEDPASFGLALSASYTKDGERQEFVLPGEPVRARYVKLHVKTNWGGAQVSVNTLEVSAVASQGNILSLPSPGAHALRNESPALLGNGAAIVRYSSATSFQVPANLLSYTSTYGWQTAGVTGEFATLLLAGGRTYSLDGVRLAASGSSTSVKDFEVWVSTTTANDAAFTRVLSATLPSTGALQDFLFPAGPVLAKYVKYVPLTSYANPSAIDTVLFDVLAEGAGGVVAFSSANSRTQRPEAALDGIASTGWFTKTASNEWGRFLLSGGASHRISGVTIVPGGSSGPKDFDVRVSTTTADPAAFTTVLSATAAAVGDPQDFVFPGGPVDARYVEFDFKTGYSNPIIIGELRLLAPPLAGGAIVATSSTTSGALDKVLGIEPNASPWSPKSAANEWVKVALPEGGPWLVDRIVLEPAPFIAPRRFEVQVSSTSSEEAAFQTVFTGALRNISSLQQFSIPPVAASYVKVVFDDAYGASIGLARLWVVSPQVGSVSARFLDRSTDIEGEPLTWAWNFGEGGASSEQDPAHVFAASGTYDVRLTTTDSAGQATNATIAYHAGAGPQTDFLFAPEAPVEGQAVNFVDLSTQPAGATVARIWDWGDGSQTLDDWSPSHVFPDAATYSVTLTAINEQGIASSASKAVTVADLPPTVTPGPDQVLVWGQKWRVGSTVLDAGAVDLAHVSCTWDFGNGESAQVAACGNTNSRIPYAYSAPGLYTATLTATDTHGATGSASLNVTVNRRDIALRVVPPLGTTTAGEQAMEVMAFAVDAFDAGASLQGKQIVFTAGSQTVSGTIDAKGVVRATILLTTGTDLAVTAAYGGDGYYHPASDTGTAHLRSTPNADRFSSRGTDFWLGFNSNFFADPFYISLSIRVTAARDTSGAVVIPGLLFYQPFSVAAGSEVKIALPGQALMDHNAVDLSADLGVHVTSLDDVSVFGLSNYVWSTDGFLALPTKSLGQNYRVLGAQGFVYAPPSGYLYSRMGIAATTDSTHVTITPAFSNVLSGRQRGIPYSITLNRGQFYQAAAVDLTDDDVSGTLVEADQPVAVFGGHDCDSMPPGVAGFCDHLIEEMPPTARWGRRFVTVPLATRNGGDTFRILAGTDATHVSINGELVATLAAGEVHQQIVAEPAQIEADAPVLVAQYANGALWDNLAGLHADPFMMLFPPVEQWQASYQTVSPALASDVFAHYVNLVAPTAAAGSIQVDGSSIPASSFVAIGTSGYSGAQLPLAAGAHSLTGTVPFAAVMYGFALTDGYGYPAGYELSDSGDVKQISLSGDASATVGVESCVVASLTGAADQVVAGAHVDFAVTGANAAGGDVTSDGNGQARFCYTGTTPGQDTITAVAGSASAAFTKTWLPGTNAPPVAQGQSLVTNAGQPLAVALVATDADGDPLTYAVTVSPQHGSLTGTAPNLTYTPASGYAGPDSFSFKANDGHADSNVAVVSIRVNAPPVAQGQSVFTNAGQPVAVSLAATDADGDPLTYTVTAAPQHGALTGTAPNLTYTPNSGYSGLDSLSFKANDGHADSNVAVVSIQVNAPPVAQSQSIFTNPGPALTISLVATDADGDPLTYVVTVAPQHGTLSGAAPSLTYRSAQGYTGPDSFSFKANDGHVDSNVALVSIRINAPPVAQSQSLVTNAGQPLAVTLVATDRDGDPLTYSITAGPQHGSLAGTVPNLTYTPAPGYVGRDLFTFKVNDGHMDSSPASISIRVNAPPAAQSQSLTTNVGQAVAVTLAATDADGDPLTYAVVTSPQHGTLTGAAPNLTYSPNSGYVGSDGFSFKANDGRVDSNIATLSITVKAQANRPPDCSGARAEPPKLWPADGQLHSIAILNVTDPDGDAAVVLKVTSIRQDEPVCGASDAGHVGSGPDGVLKPLQVRAERSASGGGRVYHIAFQATDPKGAACTAFVLVCVPIDSAHGCVDGGALFDSTKAAGK
jgi:PKD repeat protein